MITAFVLWMAEKRGSAYSTGLYSKITHCHFVKVGQKNNLLSGIQIDRRLVFSDRGGQVSKFEEFEGVTSVLLTESMPDAYESNPWIPELLESLKDAFLVFP
ncbi:hypothetical protein F4779DRAFT_636195 [Xylariaceae sp. FL0662B]|nr:hypothetical protein F4779DRAFT_636195 [Xylariaceae sp. FL0662B]